MYFVKRKTPVNFANSDLYLFNHELEKYLHLSEQIHLNFFLIHSNGSFIVNKALSNNIKEKSSIYKISKTKFILLFIKKAFKFQMFFKISFSIWFTDNWSVGYFHWMLDALPRLIESQVKTNTKILLPFIFKDLSFVIPSLNALGFFNIQFMSENKLYVFSNLKFSTHSAPTGNYNEETISHLRSLINLNSNNTLANLGRRIYVSRAKANRRKIKNENEMYPILKSFGFAVVYFENYTWQEQVAICSNANCLVGLHGAGLSNMLFMPKNSIIIELRKIGDSLNNCYFSLASALDHNYFYLQSESDHTEVLNANFVIDLVKFKFLLKSIFK